MTGMVIEVELYPLIEPAEPTHLANKQESELKPRARAKPYEINPLP